MIVEGVEKFIGGFVVCRRVSRGANGMVYGRLIGGYIAEGVMEGYVEGFIVRG